MYHIVREEFQQAGFETPTQRHYTVSAETPEQALEAIKTMRPYCLHGVQYGLVPGSKVAVVGHAHQIRQSADV